MRSIFKNIFSRKANEVEDLYDFRTISTAEVDSYPDGLKKLKSREIDGFIVKKAFNTEEVLAIDQYTRAMEKDADQVHHHKKGYVYPKPFSSLGAESPDMPKYFSDMKAIREDFHEKCGVDVEQKLFSLLGRMAGGREVSTPNFNGEEGSCIPFSLRYLKPDTGVLEVHCGNLFHSNHSAFYDHVNKTVDTHDQLSFIFVIQPSESSDLVLLDRIWKEGQHKANFEHVYSFIDEHGKEVDCSEYGIDRMKIKLEPGDFLTFAGGPIWHVVEEVKGERGRITVGGFMGFTHDDKQLMCWS